MDNIIGAEFYINNFELDDVSRTLSIYTLQAIICVRSFSLFPHCKVNLFNSLRATQPIFISGFFPYMVSTGYSCLGYRQCLRGSQTPLEPTPNNNSNTPTLPHSTNCPTLTHGINAMTLPQKPSPLNQCHLSILTTLMLFRLLAMHAKLGEFSKSPTMESPQVSLIWWSTLAAPFSLYQFTKNLKLQGLLMASPAMDLPGFPPFFLSLCGLRGSLLLGHQTSIFANFGPKISATTGEHPLHTCECTCKF